MKTPVPSLLRLPVLAVLALLAVGLLAGSAAGQAVGGAEEQLTRRINEERVAAGLRPLRTDVDLTGVARAWSPRMAGDGRLAHNPGLAQEVPGSWTRLAENVGRATAQAGDAPTAVVERLHRAFMESAGHRANVLGDYDAVGVGATWHQGELWITATFMKSGEVSASTPVDEAVRLSRQLFASAGASGRRAEHVVLGRAEVFADALGGSGLAGDRAPILFTNGPTAGTPDPALHSATAAEVDRVLGGRGRVYLLGGTGAVSGRVEHELRARGYDVRRLSGPSRVETSVRVAEEIVRLTGRPPAQVLLARADDWADAVTGGAYAAATRSPLVLTTRDTLHASTRGFLDANRGARRVVLGGRGAVADAVVHAAAAERISGRERTETAVAVAERLWSRTAAAPGDRFVLTPGHNGESWAYALSLAPWSAANRAPQLLVYDDVTAPVADYLRRLGYRDGVRGEVFTASPVSAQAKARAQQLIGP